MKNLGLINPRKVSHEEASTYQLREAARAIVLDSEDRIAFLHVTRDNYFKLPGGGAEEGENMQLALKRECLEEIGCNIEVMQDVGMTVEYWKEDIEKQISHCFLARVEGGKGTPQLTESELERGFKTVWLTYDEALDTLQNCKPTQWEGEYIVPREILFLEEARELIKV